MLGDIIISFLTVRVIVMKRRASFLTKRVGSSIYKAGYTSHYHQRFYQTTNKNKKHTGWSSTIGALAIERSESFDTLLQTYPIEQWWRLFIDGYWQYSLENRELTENEKSIYGGKRKPNYPPPACERFDKSVGDPGEKGYMTLSLYTFFSLMDKVNIPLTLEMVKEIHSNVTNGLTSSENRIYTHFNPGVLRGENNKIGFYLVNNAESNAVTTTKAGIEELKKQQDMLGIEYFSGRNPRRPDFDNSTPMVYANPCSSKDIEAKVNAMISRYENGIIEKTILQDKIELITDLVQKLVRLHPFQDGNGRTFCMQLLNRELLRHNTYPTILYNPNCFEGFSAGEMVQEIIAGQTRFVKVLKSSADDLATIEFRLGAYPNLKQYLHESTPPLIKLNRVEERSSLDFVESALAKLPNDSKMRLFHNRQDIATKLSDSLV